MRMVLGLLPVLFALPLNASAVYKCEADGKITYTDRPCASGTEQHALPEAIIIERPAKSERDLAREHDARIRRETAARDQADAEWVKNHEAKKDREKRVRSAIIQKDVIKGMSAGEVRSALGEPGRISRSESHGSPKETWTYTANGERRTVNFKNGEVSSVSKRSLGKGRK
jgi:hypothetical protein